MVFVIHWHESAMDIHVFPIPIPPPTSLSTRSLWVFPVRFFTTKPPRKQSLIRNSVQFSCSVMSDSLWLHRLQHARLPCPSPSPGAFSNSSPLNWWCQPTILSSVIHFSCLQSFPASGSFPMSWLFASGGQSFSFSISSSSEYLGLISFRNGWFDLLAVQRTLKSLSQYHS